MNRGSDSVLSVYSDARAEYTKQLCVFLVPAYFQFFIELLEKAKLDTSNEPKKSLWQFQNYLNEIHDWNMEKVHNEINKINTNSGCDYLEDLLTAVFIAHTKVLTAIRLSANKKKIEINIPKVDHFLFKVLCETSKLLWSSTYLFRDGIPGIEKQQNYRNIEQIINEGILQAVRCLVPVKSILRDFVNNDTNDINGDNETQDDNDSDDEKDETIKKDILQPILIPEKAIVLPLTPEISKPNTVPLISNTITQSSPTIIIDDTPTVRFGEYNSVFDSDNHDNTDLVYESRDEDDVPALEILDEQGVSLSEGLDFEDLNQKESENLGIGDYEDLN